MSRGGLALRIALAGFAAAGLALAILIVGVAVIGANTFTNLMVETGATVEHSRQMYDEAVMRVLVAAAVVAIVASVSLALLLARHLARPLREMERAARRVAEGDYAARVPANGPEEVSSLAQSFNVMAASLERQEQVRRDFIANAAHELRTPLTNLQGYLEALRDGVVAPDRATFESLWEEADRLVRLARSLDTLADEADEASAATSIEVAGAIRAALDLAQPAIDRAGLVVDVDVPPGLAVRANADHLAQVLGNLISNAVRYGPPGDRLAIRAEPSGGQVLISFANRGDVPDEDVPRLFERFFRVDRSRDRVRGGAGIGLAIVRQLVEAAGGRVGVESRDGQLRFWFSLPS